MSFWDRFEASPCFPDKCQCEYARDALIRQPSAFWSSLAYIFSALAIYHYVKTKSKELKLWTLVCVLMGIWSMLGHMSFTRVALAFDFSSIVLILSFFALLNVFQKLKQSWGLIVLYFCLYYSVLFSFFYMMDKWTKITACLVIFAFAKIDLLKENHWGLPKSRDLQMSLLILLFSFGIFLMDEFHVMCDPWSLFQLHSLWHIGTGVSLFFYGKWRFELAKPA